MAGLHEVACVGCGRRHMMSEARAREQRVLRCDCGQFVRLDRELSEPPAAAEEANVGASLSDSFDDEETRMFASLEELAAQLPGGASLLGEAPKASAPAPASPPAASAADLYDDEDEATRVVSSPASLLRSLAPKANAPSIPPKSHSHSGPAPTGPNEDKPLWYVDLGGNETLEMTIEQLIVARRAGRLGEGALVWRAGMARWRPIGTLIPAAGSGVAARPLPPPSLPSKPQHAAPVPSRPSQAAPPPEPGLGSYRRPMATLEFALEEKKAESAGKLAGPPPPPAPLPHPSAPPPPRRQSSGAPAPTLPSNQRPSDVSPISSNSGHVTAIDAGSGAHGPFGRRYSPVVIAIGISIVASAMGALLVRVLRTPPPPATATLSTASSDAPSLAPSAPIAPSAPAVAATPSPAAPAPPASAAPQVVDIDSLSVEKKPAPRPVAPLAAPPTPLAAPPTPRDSDAAPTPAPAPRAPVPSSALKQAIAGATDATSSGDSSEASPTPAPKPKAKPEPSAPKAAAGTSDALKKPGRDDPGF